MTLGWKLVILGLILAALTALGMRVHHNIWQSGYAARDAESKQAALEAARKNDIIQTNLQSDADKLKGTKDAEIRSINARLADALGDYSMLQRSQERRVDDLPTDTGNCRGGTGAGLSGPDAGFLTREAARGNALRAALAECYAVHRKIRDAQPAPAR